MSSLIFYTDKEQAFIATDTLATSPEGNPKMFTTKSFIVPHLQMIMSGTGMGGFLGRWFREVNDRMIVRDIENLDYHTPKALISLWREFRNEYSVADGLTTTVYHFGFSENDDTIHTFAYRSVNNFVSERLPFGVGVKPERKSSDGIQFPTDLKKVMDEQRTIQKTYPKTERVYIGGKIQVHHLTKSGFNVYTCDQFDDFEVDQRSIFENYEHGT